VRGVVRAWTAAAIGAAVLLGGTAGAQGGVQVVVNGRPLAGGPPPMLVDGTTYVPLRPLAAALGAQVTWDGATATASVTGPSGGRPDLPGIVAQVAPSVVGVVAVTHDPLGRVAQVSSGSGVVVAPGGVVVTNHHVLAGADTVFVVTAPGQALQVAPTAIWDDPPSDLAFLRTGDGALPVAHLGRSTPVQVGEDVIAIGNPLGAALADTVTRGIVSGVGRYLGPEEMYPVLQTDAAINPGNSGGALVDMQGNVIGITSEKVAGAEVQGLGFAKPAALVAEILSSFERLGYVVRPYMGVGLQDPWQVAYGLPTSDGPTVTGLDPAGPAAQAGIRLGDEIVGAGGQPVHSAADLFSVLQASAPGTALPVTVLRGGTQLQLTVTLAQRPAGE
jgi:serine protease Do